MKKGCSPELLAGWVEQELDNWRYQDPNIIGERDQKDMQLENVLIEQRVMPPAPPSAKRR